MSNQMTFSKILPVLSVQCPKVIIQCKVLFINPFSSLYIHFYTWKITILWTVLEDESKRKIVLLCSLNSLAMRVEAHAMQTVIPSGDGWLCSSWILHKQFYHNLVFSQGKNPKNKHHRTCTSKLTWSRIWQASSYCPVTEHLASTM